MVWAILIKSNYCKIVPRERQLWKIKILEKEQKIEFFNVIFLPLNIVFTFFFVLLIHSVASDHQYTRTSYWTHFPSIKIVNPPISTNQK